MAFLHVVSAGESSYVLRGLQPSEDRISLATGTLKQRDWLQLMDSMGQLVAWAHLRGATRQGAAGPDELMDYAQRHKWQIKLLDFTQDCAQLVRKDAKQFNAAFDDKVFNGV